MRQGNTKDERSQKKYDVTQQEEARVTPVNPKAFTENWYDLPRAQYIYIYIYYIYIWVFPKILYPRIIHFNRAFHYKPSILGYPYFWKHPYIYNDHGSYGYSHWLSLCIQTKTPFDRRLFCVTFNFRCHKCKKGFKKRETSEMISHYSGEQHINSHGNCNWHAAGEIGAIQLHASHLWWFWIVFQIIQMRLLSMSQVLIRNTHI